MRRVLILALVVVVLLGVRWYAVAHARPSPPHSTALAPTAGTSTQTVAAGQTADAHVLATVTAIVASTLAAQAAATSAATTAQVAATSATTVQTSMAGA